MWALNHFMVRLETNTQKIVGNKYNPESVQVSLRRLKHAVVQKLELQAYVILGLRSEQERSHHIGTLNL